MEKLSKEQILGLANELHFTLSEAEISEVSNEFEVLMQQLEMMDAIDTEDVDEMVYPLDSVVAILREDVVDHVLDVEEALKNAPKVKDNYVVVPKVIA